MGALREKLHEERGASMLMALLLLLVALMVSAVVIAAASSAATTLRSDRAQEQAALSVTSAAEYVRDAFQAGEMNGTVRTSWSSNTVTYSPGRRGGAFSEFLKSAAPQVYNNTNAPAQKAIFRLSVADDAVEDVWADFSLSFGKDENSDYPTFVLTVTLRNYETVPGEHPCSTVLVLYSNLSNSRNDYSYRATVQDVTWDGYSTIQR